MKPLNYTTKAIADLMNYPCNGAPGTRAGLRYIAEKLRKAEVFLLSDHGELLDRSKPRPEVPGLMFKPPFPVVALEYSAATKEWGSSPYTESRASRRIALAWEWEDDLPASFAGIVPKFDTPGVVVASVTYFDDHGLWMPIAAAAFMPYSGQYRTDKDESPFRDAMVAEGRISRTQAAQAAFETRAVPLMPEAIIGMIKQYGVDGMHDLLRADLMDEANAYTDLCIAMACKNVSPKRHPASRALNRCRLTSGKPALKDFHVLELAGGGELPGHDAGDRNGPRSHLRRGHIRRLSADRVTWVNATMVSGRGGFVDKQYSIGRKA